MDLTLPQLGEGADSGVVVNVFVKEGDTVAKDQPVIELENEKAVASIPSTAAGVVSKIHVKEGDKLSVGQKILSVETEGKTAAARPSKAEALKERDRGPEVEEAEEPEPEEAEEEGAPAEGEQEATVEEGREKPVAAAPSLRRLARELGIDLTRVRGSERGGRIVSADVRAYIERLQKSAFRKKVAPAAPAAKPAAEQIDFSRWGTISRKPISQLRQVISRRMLENWTTIPHVTQFDEADITGILELRKKHGPAYEEKGTRLTVTPFVMKALAATLKKHPLFNASLDEASQEIVLKEYFHIGIAVDTEAGLLVPVIRDVDKKSLLDLSREIEGLAQKARERKLSLDEMKGGTFTISNQGGIGGGHFTPIINKPEVAILGLGRGAAKPVVRDGKVETRTMLPLALSYDHRLIDGADAARFMVDLVEALEKFTGEDVASP